ncbi:MAG: MFS transporter [Chloroflexales bacterium]|nr:MFS transporter [Chloroflexales bacterium]
MSEQIIGAARTGGAARNWRQPSLRVLLIVQYALFSVVIGLQGVLWGEVQQTLALDEGVFGTAMAVTPLTGFAVLVLAGPYLRLIGRRRLAVGGLLTIAGALLALGTAQTMAGLLLARLLAGLGFALVESSATSTALDWEAASGCGLLGVLYGVFSGGVVVGALLGGALLGLGVSYRGALLLLVPGVLLAAVASSLAGYPQASPTPGAPPVRAPLALLRNRGFQALAAVCLLGVAGEALADLWAVIYLRTLGATPLISGAAFALFNGAMIGGRLANGALHTRLGVRRLVQLSGLGVAGAAGLLALGGVLSSVTAFGLLGLAVAGVMPTVLGLARVERAGGDAAVRGLVATTYLGFVLAPPLIGWLAEHTGLGSALLLCLGLISLGLGALAWAIPPSSGIAEE